MDPHIVEEKSKQALDTSIYASTSTNTQKIRDEKKIKICSFTIYITAEGKEDTASFKDALLFSSQNLGIKSGLEYKGSLIWLLHGIQGNSDVPWMNWSTQASYFYVTSSRQFECVSTVDCLWEGLTNPQTSVLAFCPSRRVQINSPEGWSVAAIRSVWMR